METRTHSKTRKSGKGKPQQIVIKTQFDLNYTGSSGEFNKQPSETVPDQHMSIKDLLLNHTRGITPALHQYDPNYFDVEIPRILDLTDLEEFRNELNAREKELQAAIKKEFEEHKAKIEAEKNEIVDRIETIANSQNVSENAPNVSKTPKSESSEK